MSRNTTYESDKKGSKSKPTKQSNEQKLERLFKGRYYPSKIEIEAKHKFHHRMNNGHALAGTPKNMWSRAFVGEVLGYDINIKGEEAWDWFIEEKSFDESAEALAHLALGVLRDNLIDSEAKPSDKNKAIEIALKTAGKFQPKQASKAEEDAEKKEAENATIEKLKKAGLNTEGF